MPQKCGGRINNDDILFKTLIDDTLTHCDDGIKQRGKYLPREEAPQMDLESVLLLNDESYGS
jgi:hypothetical protein